MILDNINPYLNHSLLYVDPLSLVMMVFILFLGLCVMTFSARYLRGDEKRTRILSGLGAFVMASLIVFSANNILLFSVAWMGANISLVRLIAPKTSKVSQTHWYGARFSYLLAKRNFMFGFLMILGAFVLLWTQTHQTSIQGLLINVAPLPKFLTLALILLLVGAMTQCALWPCDRWLISASNAPTPILALMHTALIGNGIFLIVRFAPLYLEFAYLLQTLFVVGLISLLIGSAKERVHGSEKQRLASSTITQSGFTIMLCGLGFFPVAIAHLLSQGLFKAYLFLGLGSPDQKRRWKKTENITPQGFFCALMCGLVGVFIFLSISGIPFSVKSTSIILAALVWMAGAQCALYILNDKPLRRILLAISFVGVVAFLSGLSIALVNIILAPLSMMHPQPLQTAYSIGFYFAGLGVLCVAWCVSIFSHQLFLRQQRARWYLKIYVKLLNAAQPHPQTITPHRNDYHY